MPDAAETPPPSVEAEPGEPQRPHERTIVLVVLGAIAFLALSRGSISREAIILILAIVPSIILHEVSHGAVANAFGDDTAKRAGRLTLNPIAHVDAFGTIIMPSMLALSGLPPFGYAKPVPVNVARLRHPRNNSVLVGLAGPATNFALAAIAALLFRAAFPDLPGLDSTLAEVLVNVGIVNVLLGSFNMLPVPPLDGSALVERLLPAAWWPGYLRFRRYSMFLVLIVVFWFDGVLEAVYRPGFDVWQRIAGL